MGVLVLLARPVRAVADLCRAWFVGFLLDYFPNHL